ncbi:MAG: hypothetical protein ACFFDI_25545 [Promethearchaeota archaeon]
MSKNEESELKELKACFRFSWLGFLVGALCSFIPVIIASFLIFPLISPSYYWIILILIFAGAICGGLLSGFTGEFGPKIGIVGSIIGGISGIAGSITAGLTGNFLQAIVAVLIISGIIGIIILFVLVLLGGGMPGGGEEVLIFLGVFFGFGIGFPGASIGTIASYAIGSQLGFSLAAAIVGSLIGGISSLIVGFLCSGGIGAFFSSRECLKRCQRTLPNWIAQHGSLDLESLNVAKFVLGFPTNREWIVSWVKSGNFPSSLQLRENETKLVNVSR